MRLREVLVIDDNDADLTWTRLMLDEARVADVVRTFGTGREALAYLEQAWTHVDAVLLDVNMPEMSGFEFLERYTALGSTYQVQAMVVILSSSGDARDRAYASKFSCVRGHLIKPIDEDGARYLEVLAERRRTTSDSAS